MQKLIEKITNAKSIVLSTHRECDGDGLGAQIALYYGLKKLGKNVRVLNLDWPAERYSYLNFKNFLQSYVGPHRPLEKSDLVLIFDTNDKRLLGRLWAEFEKYCHDICFVDHHPPLTTGPAPTSGSFINTSAASTGEIAFDIIKALKIEIDTDIAEALYTSVAFDTQVFKFVRHSPKSHLIAAELLQHPIRAEEIHRRLFSSHTREKIEFLAKALSTVEYFDNNRMAFMKIRDSELAKYGLTADETRDIIDMIMQIETLEAAVILREDDTDTFKVSFRSKGQIAVHTLAEMFGGGGHPFAAGATVHEKYEVLKEKVLKQMHEQMRRKSGSEKN